MQPSIEWKEVVSPGEADRHEALGRALADLQRESARGGAPLRTLHAKGQVGAMAEFTVLPEVPEHLRIGLFAAPATYRAYVRVSNGGRDRQSDKVPDVRGLAVKVVGVGGRKLIPGLENARTQDFLAIRGASQPLPTAADFVWLLEAARTPALLPLKMLARFGPVRGVQILRRLVAGLGGPARSVAHARYFSALPSRLGPYAMHFDLRPHETTDAVLAPSREHFADDLRSRLARGPVVWDFRVQLFVDEQRTPIEDPTVEWKESDAPFVTLARLTLPQQDLGSPRGARVAAFVEKLSFDPWHAQEELRPLGEMQRARNVAYRVSTQARGAAPEPDGTESFEDDSAHG